MKKILSIAVIVVLLVGVPIYCFFSRESPAEAAGYSLLELWHVETFEGGAYSRAGWLKARLKEFEKQNPGTIVHLNVLTAEQLSDAVERGDKFDLVSFSAGIGDAVLPKVREYRGKMNVRADLASYGVTAGKQMAVPYLLGGYLLAGYSQNISKLQNKDSLVENIFNAEIQKKLSKTTLTLKSLDYGNAAYNLPLLSLVAANAPEGQAEKGGKTQYQAYEGFLSGNVSTLFLGTQRDLSRLQNRVKAGKLSGVEYQFLSGFSDLVQYLSLGSDKADAVRLVEYLTSDKAQKTISGLLMFGVNGASIHTDEVFCEMERALSAELKSINAFISPENIEKLKNDVNDALADKSLRNQLLNGL